MQVSLTAIANLYNKAKSFVLFNDCTGDWSRTIVGFRQGCLLSLVIFNVFLERISDTLKDHMGSVSIVGRTFINFRFADGIIVYAEEEKEADGIITSMDGNWS